MAVNIIKHDASFKMVDSLSLQFTKFLITHKSPNGMHPDAKTQPVLYCIVKRYTHISR